MHENHTPHWRDQMLEFALALAGEAEDFPKALLALISKSFGFNRMLFFLYAHSSVDIEKRSRRDALSNFVALNLDPSVMNEYGSMISELDIFAPRRLPEHLRGHKVLYTDDVMPREQYLETKYYAYMSGKGMQKQACIYLHYKKEVIGNICVFRSEKEPDFTEEERALMEYLSDIISKQYMRSIRLSEDVMSQEGFRRLFRAAKVGAVLLNSRLMVLMANGLAQEYCSDFVRDYEPESGYITRSSYQRSSQYGSIQRVIDRIGLDLVKAEQSVYRGLREEYDFFYWPLVITNLFGDVETRHLIVITKTVKERSPELSLAVESLTPREKEILEYLLLGKSTQAIAELLHITAYTVRTHISNIYQKFSVGSRSELLIKLNELQE